jgi:hypothetical protein
MVALWPSRKRQGSWVNTCWEEDGDTNLVYYQESDLPEFYIACGPTVRGSHHAVVYSKGALAHDPHYSGDGLVSVDRIEFFQAIPGEQRIPFCLPTSAVPQPVDLQG